jgi:hypothetical protein
LDAPEIDCVPQVQKWPAEEAKWWYAGGGRMLFPAGLKENWQVMWFHKGKAGTGKSTSLKFWMAFYPLHRIGMIANMTEKQFGLQALRRAWGWFAPDVNEFWRMDQKTWNDLVDAGLVPVAVKREEAENHKLRIHGAACSNSFLGYNELNGELLRRLVAHFYNVYPRQNIKSNLDERMIKNSLCISLKKIVCAYLDKTKQYGDRVLANPNLTETVLPSSMVDNLKEICRHANPLLGFMHSHEVVLNPDYFTEQHIVRKSFTDYFVRTNRGGNKKTPSFSADMWKSILDLVGCREETNPNKLPWKSYSKGEKPNSTSKIWIVGCSIKRFEKYQVNLPPDFQEAKEDQQQQQRSFSQQQNTYQRMFKS